MAYINDDGHLVSDTNNETFEYVTNQIDGLEQFVAIKNITITEALPPFKDYKKLPYNIVPKLSSNGSDGYEVYASANIKKPIDAYKVFSGDVSDYVEWDADYGWVMIDLQKNVYIDSYAITTTYAIDEDALPLSWKLLGSNDSRNWVELDSVYGNKLYLGNTLVFNCNSPNSFRYIRFEWSETSEDIGYSVLSNIDLFGVDSLSFDVEFDGTQQVGVCHLDYTTEVTFFDNVVRLTQDGVKCLSDGSLINHFTLNNTLIDSISGEELQSVDYTPRYVGDSMTFSTYKDDMSFVCTPTELPISSFDGFTVSAKVRLVTRDSDDKDICIFRIGDGNNCAGDSTCDVAGVYTDGTDLRRLYLSSSRTGTSKKVYTQYGAMPINEFVEITLVVEKDKLSLYIDGVLQCRMVAYATMSFLYDSFVYLNEKYRSGTFSVKNFRLFNTALTQNDVVRLSNIDKTVASLPSDRMPKYFTLFDSTYTINGKRLQLQIDNMLIERNRKKFRYIDYYLDDGNSVDNYTHVVEIQALNDALENISNNSTVLTYPTGNGKNYVITDGDLSSYNYYASNTSYARIRIDLGEEKDIRYVQFWNYYTDRRYYNNIRVWLSNYPTVTKNPDGENYLIYSTRDRGTYIETEDGKVVSNLEYDTKFIITYKADIITIPPEYDFTFVIQQPQSTAEIRNIFFEINRNLWHIKPRMLKSIKENVTLEDMAT